MDTYFDYLYGNEAEKYAFYRIPKTLFNNPYFQYMSTDAKLLYALFLDRASLSKKNGWCDSNNHIFIIYSIDNIIEDLNCSKKKACQLKQELAKIGLVEIKKRGQGNPDLIFVKNFETVLNSEKSELPIKAGNTDTLRSVDNEILEVSHLPSIETDNNTNDRNETESSSADDVLILQRILPNINFDELDDIIASPDEQIVIAIIQALKKVVTEREKIKYKDKSTKKEVIIQNPEAVAAYKKLNNALIHDVLDRMVDAYDSITDIVSYAEVSLYRAAISSPKKEKPLSSQNERHYSPEDYAQMEKEIIFRGDTNT